MHSTKQYSLKSQTVLLLIGWLMLMSGWSAKALSAEASYQPGTLAEVQAQYQLLLQLRQENSISDNTFQGKYLVLQSLAKNQYDVELNEIELQSAAENRIDRLGSGLYAISAILLLGLVVKLLSYLPAIVNEVVVYSAAIVVLGGSDSEYLTLVGGFTLAGVLLYSIHSRVTFGPGYYYATGVPLTIAFFLLAIIFDNNIFGFACTLAFLFSFGFLIVVFPGAVIVGSPEGRLATTFYLTVLSLLFSLLVWLTFYTPWVAEASGLQRFLTPFKEGMLINFPLAYFAGVSQLRFYLLGNRPWLRLIAESVGLFSELAMLTLALLYQLDVMFWIGSLFISWNCMDKFYRLIYRRFSFTASCTLFAILFGGAGGLIKYNMDTIKPYLEFLGL